MSFVDWKNDEEAEEYLKNIAAEYSFACYKEKEPDGCRLLGEYEYNVKANYPVAARIFQHACDEYNEAESCNKVAYMKAIGKGIPKDTEGAKLCAEKACKQKAKTCLTAALFASKEKNWADMSKYLERACNEGDVASACTRLAHIKLKGHSAPVKNPSTGKEVMALLDKACELGDPPGCINASALLFGRAEKLAKDAGIETNAEKAIFYRDRAKQLAIPGRGGAATT